MSMVNEKTWHRRKRLEEITTILKEIERLERIAEVLASEDDYVMRLGTVQFLKMPAPGAFHELNVPDMCGMSPEFRAAMMSWVQGEISAHQAAITALEAS